jgi:acetate kinase
VADAVLVINAGSSSVKFALFSLTAEPDALPAQATLSGQVAGIGEQTRITAADGQGRVLLDRELPTGAAVDPHHQALDALLRWIEGHNGGVKIVAVGHRVVHGGDRFSAPIRLDPAVIAALDEFIPLAPLHQPHNLDAIRTIGELLPDAVQVACFDTAFHRGQPELAQLFAVPRAITAAGVRRYGFHGLSYEYIADVLPTVLPGGAAEADGRVVVAHLGNGASMCAMRHRKSVATTMGFTAIEGLMMGTRCGSVDPGVLLYLMQYRGYDAAALNRLLYHESGLLGVSGISSDMRTLLNSTHPQAQEAIDLFCYRIVRELGSLVAAIGGLDTLVFTGGIGEHAAPVREQVCRASAWLGIDFDAAANASHANRISHVGSRVTVLVLPTNEEHIIARHTARLLAPITAA